MLTRTSIILAVIALLTPSLATAQRNEEKAVIVEALRYLRKDLGPNMVIDGRLPATLPAKQGKAPLSDIATLVQAKVAHPLQNRRCSERGLGYFIGPERYVIFQNPEFSSDSASLRVKWRYTPEGTQRTIVMATTIMLRRVANGWEVVNQVDRRTLHTNWAFCDLGMT
jgi:hypothetical protein